MKPVDRRPEIVLTQGELSQARSVLQRHGITATTGLVGIHIGAKGEVKRWFPDRFARISDVLFERGWTPILFGGKGDQKFLDEICRTVRHRPTILHQRSLRELIALIDQCSVFVCHDSGPMHLAVARAVPVVALFGPTHPKLGFWPLGDQDVVVTADVHCSPCSLHGTKRCRKRQRDCMEQITVDRVVETVLRVATKGKERCGRGA